MGWVINPRTSGKTEKEKIVTAEGERPCEANADKLECMSTSQGIPGIAWSHQKLPERHGKDLPLEPLERTSPASTLISDLWNSKL